jgi:hypothetical protein
MVPGLMMPPFDTVSRVLHPVSGEWHGIAAVGPAKGGVCSGMGAAAAHRGNRAAQPASGHDASRVPGRGFRQAGQGVKRTRTGFLVEIGRQMTRNRRSAVHEVLSAPGCLRSNPYGLAPWACQAGRRWRPTLDVDRKMSGTSTPTGKERTSFSSECFLAGKLLHNVHHFGLGEIWNRCVSESPGKECRASS